MHRRKTYPKMVGRGRYGGPPGPVSQRSFLGAPDARRVLERSTDARQGHFFRGGLLPIIEPVRDKPSLYWNRKDDKLSGSPTTDGS
jgi:hypothetical protein